MKRDWHQVWSTFFLGLFMTGVGIAWVSYLGWDIGSILCLLVGPLFLLSSFVLTISYVTMTRKGNSRLPEGWESLSLAERREHARERTREESRKGSIGAKFALLFVSLMDVQKRHKQAFFDEEKH